MIHNAQTVKTALYPSRLLYTRSVLHITHDSVLYADIHTVIHMLYIDITSILFVQNTRCISGRSLITDKERNH